MCRPAKTLNNFTFLPNPPTLGNYPQLLISDGNEGTTWSNSLMGEEAATLSAYVSEDFISVGDGVGGTAGRQLISGIGAGEVALGLDISATTNRGFVIFNPFTGANNTPQRILVSVNYSVNLSGGTVDGDKGVWVQIIGADSILKPARYGFAQQQSNGAGNHLTGSTVIGLQPMEAAAFFLMNTSNTDVTMLGGDIDLSPMATKFQSALLN